MAKRLTATLFFLLAVFVTYEAKAQSMHFILASKSTKKVENTTLWTITASCSIQSKADKNEVVVSMLKNKGSVNGKSLNPGHKTAIMMHAHNNLTVVAEPGATVNVTNEGQNTIEATCSA